MYSEEGSVGSTESNFLLFFSLLKDFSKDAAKEPFLFSSPSFLLLSLGDAVAKGLVFS